MGAYLTIYLSEDNVDVSANTSRLKIQITVTTTGSTYNEEGSLYGNFWGTVSGNYSGAVVGKESTATVYQGYHTITHDTEGKRTVSIGSTCYVTNSTNCSTSATKELTTIPRASVIGTVDNFNLEEPFIVPVDKKATAFIDELTISYVRVIQAKEYKVKIATRDNYNGETITLDLDELATAYECGDGTYDFTVTTRNGTEMIGTSSTTATGTINGTLYQAEQHGIAYIKIGTSWKKAISSVKLSSWRRGS